MSSLNLEFHTTYPLGEAKKKNKQIKKVAVAFFFCGKPSKKETSFWAKPKKNKQVKKEVVVFLKQKGNVFFFISSHSKKDKKQSFFSCLLNALLKISHRLSSKKW